MTERTDITVDWAESPRIVEVAVPSAALIIQDLHDTLRADTGVGFAESDLDNLDEPYLIDSGGKEDLGGGNKVGITSTLQNAQVAFESRLTPTSTGTVTTGNSAGEVLIDNLATFVTDGVSRGAVVINFSDQSISEVLEVLAETQVRTRVLRAGTTNQYNVGNAYKIWNVAQCVVSGGNLVAVDDLAAAISPIFPTFATQVIISQSASATLQESTEIQELHGQLQREVFIDTAAATNGNGYQQSPFNNWTDAVDAAEANGITNLVLLGDATMDRTLKNFSIRGIGEPDIDGNSHILQGVELHNCGLTGNFATGTDLHLYHCHLHNGVTGIDGEMHECGFGGAISLAAGNAVHAVDCYSLLTATPPSVDVGGGGCSTSIRSYRGGLTIKGMDNAADEVTVSVAQGKAFLDSTNTDGAFSIRGVAYFADTSNGTTVDDQGLLHPDQMAEVWAIMGLDPASPLTVTKTSQSAGGISQAIGGDGENISTVTRNP